jgi:hypothetical protein
MLYDANKHVILSVVTEGRYAKCYLCCVAIRSFILSQVELCVIYIEGGI